MSSNTSNTEYGIGKSFPIVPFDGSDPSKLPTLKKSISIYLLEKEINLPQSKDDQAWLASSQMRFAGKAHSRLKVTLQTLATPANSWMVDMGYVVDDLQLTTKERREYEQYVQKKTSKKQLAVQILKQFITLGSGAEAAITNGYNLNDFRIMWFDLLDFYEGLLLHNAISRVNACYLLSLNSGKGYQATVLMDKLSKAEADYNQLMQVDKKRGAETDAEFQDRVLKSKILYSYLYKIVVLEQVALDKAHVKAFVNVHIRDILTDVYAFNPVTNLTQLRSFLSTQVTTPVNPTVQQQPKQPTNLVTDKSVSAQHTVNLTNRIKNLEKKLSNTSKVNVATGAAPTVPGAGGGKKRDRFGIGPCTVCNDANHDAEHCFKNPNASEETKKRAISFNLKRANNSVHVTTTAPVADATLSIMNLASSDSGNDSFHILLDSGSDCVLFNRFHYDLLFSLKPHSSGLSGIGGDTGIRISDKGTVVLMGCLIHDCLYSSLADRSVVSEGLICALYNFKIIKDGMSCILINKDNNYETTLQLDLTSMKYILPANLFDINYDVQVVNLASVRPNNLKTLWHARFGHAYMGLIVKMARVNVYQDRGLKLPELLLRTDPEEDLCDACALGKPTFSFDYVPHHRSTIKGKLWYFDVSGGGNLTPSLVKKNRYKYMFADSCTRMYFVYYTTRVNDATTLRILNLFREEILVTLTFDDNEEIIFFQSDNGQLDTNEVKSWMRKGRAITRFGSPYHPNMNGFVERAFGSTNALARCMLAGAGLPDPYWERASRHAVLLRNIMPNQTSDGFVREAYFLWYGLTYDYSRLRTWGCRAYALNHIREKDYGNRSVSGIFVGMNPDNAITRDYEIYLPTKDKFVTTGDVLFCEHVGRLEPERLLPPSLSLPDSAAKLDAKDYQNLVDTVHLDNDEGVQYRVLKVYNRQGAVVVDRVLFDPAIPNAPGGTIDTVYLDNVIGYPIILGGSNPRYQTDVPARIDEELITLSHTDQPVRNSVREEVDIHGHALETLHQRAKRLRTEATLAGEAKNTAEKHLRRSQRNKSYSNVATSVTSVSAKEQIAKVIFDWSFEHFPEYLDHITETEHITHVTSTSNDHTNHRYKLEPRHHAEAMSRDSEREDWIASEKREMDALDELNFAEIVDIPSDREPLPVTWVYKYKTDQFGNRVLFKSRLVVRGDLAIAGFDFFETYSPVAKIDSIRLILAIIITHKFIPAQFDIGNAYVQSLLEEKVYIKAIPGRPLPLGKCLRLLRSLYGLPQSGRNWNLLIDKDFTDIGFVKIREDLCVYVLFENGEMVAAVGLYVDDFFAGFDSIERMDWFANSISALYKTKALGLPTNVVGLALTWVSIPGQIYYESVHIVNAKSVNVLAEKFELVGAKPVKLPYNLANKLSKSQGPTESQLLCPEVKLMQRDYRTLVGTFIWLSITTRVDIISIVLILSQFVSNPAYQHYQAALWLVKYLNSTINLGITYHMNGDPNIVGYVDADHASHESRRSVYSYIFMFAGGPIFWKNGFETRFSLSTGESEVRAVYALREAIKHVLYLKKMLKSFLLDDAADNATIAMAQLPTAVFEDNLAAIRFSLNPASQSTMKYLEVDILWIHDAIERGEFKLVKIDTTQQLADIGTKLNIAEVFYRLRSQLMN